MTFLLDSANELAKWSDLLSSKWAEILGWISIPTVVSALIVCIFKLITACVSKKISKKSIKPLADKVEEVKSMFSESLEELKNIFENNIEDYSSVIEAKINNALQKYEEAKKIAYEEIMQGEEFSDILKDIKPETIVGEFIEEPINDEKEEEIISGPIEENEDIIIEEIDPLSR